jgi:hypothetical protein
MASPLATLGSGFRLCGSRLRFNRNAYCLKVNLKYNNTSDKESTTKLAKITGPLPIPKPYTSHKSVLKMIINIIQILKSPTLLLCQALYTCGINVMADKNEPAYPTNSIQFIY